MYDWFQQLKHGRSRKRLTCSLKRWNANDSFWAFQFRKSACRLTRKSMKRYHLLHLPSNKRIPHIQSSCDRLRCKSSSNNTRTCASTSTSAQMVNLTSSYMASSHVYSNHDLIKLVWVRLHLSNAVHGIVRHLPSRFLFESAYAHIQTYAISSRYICNSCTTLAGRIRTIRIVCLHIWCDRLHAVLKAACRTTNEKEKEILEKESKSDSIKPSGPFIIVKLHFYAVEHFGSIYVSANSILDYNATIAFTQL